MLQCTIHYCWELGRGAAHRTTMWESCSSAFLIKGKEPRVLEWPWACREVTQGLHLPRCCRSSPLPQPSAHSSELAQQSCSTALTLRCRNSPEGYNLRATAAKHLSHYRENREVCSMVSPRAPYGSRGEPGWDIIAFALPDFI